MARPKKNEELAASAYIGTRVPEEIRQAMERKAESAGRTLAQEVRVAFERHVAARKPGKAKG